MVFALVEKQDFAMETVVKADQ